MTTACMPRYRLISQGDVTFGFTLRSEVILESIVAALADAAQQGHLPVPAAREHENDAGYQAAASARAVAQSALQENVRRRDKLLVAIESGQMDPRALSILNDRLMALVEESQRVQESLAHAERNLSTLQAAARAGDLERHIERILEFVQNLADPHSIAAHEFLRAAMQRLDFALTAGENGRVLSWQGQLHLSQGTSTAVIVQFSGRHPVPPEPAPTGEQLAAALVRGSSGLPLDGVLNGIASGGRKKVIQQLSEALGLAPIDSWILRTPHTALLRAYLAIAGPPDRGIQWADVQPELEPVFGDTAKLLERLTGELDRKRQATTVIRHAKRSEPEAALLIAHATGATYLPPAITRIGLSKGTWESTRVDWTREGHTYRLRPCQACGSRRRIKLVLNEPDGYVCLDCRRDNSGITWRADPFDDFVMARDMWIDAGVLQPAAGALQAAERRQKRGPEVFTDEQRKAVAMDYESGMSGREVINKHELRTHYNLNRVLDQEGIARRTVRATGSHRPRYRTRQLDPD